MNTTNLVIDALKNNPALAAAIGSGVSLVASEVIGMLPIKSNSLLQLAWNIGKIVVKATFNKKGN